MPAAAFVGSPGALRVRLLDASGTPGTITAAPVDVSASGGTTGISTADVQLTTVVEPASLTVQEMIRSADGNSLTLLFGTSVRNFDLASLTLTRNGRPLPVRGLRITGQSATWTISGLTANTKHAGTYKLTINHGRISDAQGTLMPKAQAYTWVR
jgi:hypothetical protein